MLSPTIEEVEVGKLAITGVVEWRCLRRFGMSRSLIFGAILAVLVAIAVDGPERFYLELINYLDRLGLPVHLPVQQRVGEFRPAQLKSFLKRRGITQSIWMLGELVRVRPPLLRLNQTFVDAGASCCPRNRAGGTVVRSGLPVGDCQAPWLCTERSETTER